MRPELGSGPAHPGRGSETARGRGPGAEGGAGSWELAAPASRQRLAGLRWAGRWCGEPRRGAGPGLAPEFAQRFTEERTVIVLVKERETTGMK